MGRNWRKGLTTKELPSRDELLPQFTNLIDQIVDIVLGRTSGSSSKYLTYWFMKTVAKDVLGVGPTTGSANSHLMVRHLVEACPNLSEADIRQQTVLYLIEMWSFYRTKIKPGKKTRFVFYDYVRFNLIKHVASWVGQQILLNTGDQLAPQFSDVTYMDEPDDLDFSLGWVMLKSNRGVLAELSTRQKYLMYLRYVKSMTIIEIASLLSRHRSLVEKDFSVINRVLGIGGHYVNSRNTS